MLALGAGVLLATSAVAQQPQAAPPPAGAATTAALQAAPTGTQAQTADTMLRAPYRVNPGDEIEVYVWGEERLQRQLRVLPDGSFGFPLAGSVRAEGRTTSEIEAELSRRLASQFRGVPPQVTVSVRNPSGNTISIMGKVRAPGAFSPARTVDIVSALALAGGTAEFADLNNVVILRNENGGLRSIKVPLGALMRGNPGRNLAESVPELRAGDIVIVP